MNGGAWVRCNDLLGGAHECPCVRNIFEQDCAFPDCYGGELMGRAPKDGTEIEILFRHANFFYAAPEDRHQWQQWCRAYWTDFNGGGWVWRGICGEPLCWRPVEPNGAHEGRR